MADFQFLRLEKPDVKRYLPHFLNKDKTFKRLQEAFNSEHEIQRQQLIDLCKQFFVETATWGLDMWENVYQTHPPSGADYASRRAMIITKMMGNQTMTKQTIELIINQFTSNGRGYVEEDTAPGTITIVLPCTVKEPALLSRALNEMLPAHIRFEFQLILSDIEVDGEDFTKITIKPIKLYCGIIPVLTGRKTIGIGFPSGHQHKVYTGVVHAITGHKTIGISKPEPVSIQSRYGIIHFVTGRKTIGGIK